MISNASSAFRAGRQGELELELELQLEPEPEERDEKRWEKRREEKRGAEQGGEEMVVAAAATTAIVMMNANAPTFVSACNAARVQLEDVASTTVEGMPNAEYNAVYLHVPATTTTVRILVRMNTNAPTFVPGAYGDERNIVDYCREAGDRRTLEHFKCNFLQMQSWHKGISHGNTRNSLCVSVALDPG